MQRIDVTSTNIAQQRIPNSTHLEQLYSLYGSPFGLDRNLFFEFALAHEANGGLSLGLGNEHSIDGATDYSSPMALAFLQRAKGSQDNQDYQDFIDEQLSQQEREAAQSRAGEDSRRSQAIAESERLALEPRAEPDIGRSAFGEMIVPGGARMQSSQPTTTFLRGKTKRMQIATKAQKRLQTVEALSGRRQFP